MVFQLLLGFMVALSLLPRELGAASGPPTDYASCLLHYVKPARSETAATLLQTACQRRHPPARENARPATGNDPGGKERTLEIRMESDNDFTAYDTCLMQHLAAVHNDQSARWTAQYCKDQYAPVNADQAPGDRRQAGLLELLNALDGGQRRERTASGSAPTIDGDGFVPLTPARAGR